MPGSYEDPVTEGIAAGLGYVGVRGTGSLKPCCGANTTLASGYDVLNILSQGIVPNYQGMTYAGMRNRVSQDLFKNALWGRPIGYFWHVNELRPDEVENLMDAFVQGGAVLKSNTAMVSFLLGCTANDAVPAGYVAGSYYVCPSSGVEADFRPTANSPVRDAGVNLGTEWQYDLMGINQNSFGSGWEMGALRLCAGEFECGAVERQVTGHRKTRSAVTGRRRKLLHFALRRRSGMAGVSGSSLRDFNSYSGFPPR